MEIKKLTDMQLIMLALHKLLANVTRDYDDSFATRIRKELGLRMEEH